MYHNNNAALEIKEGCSVRFSSNCFFSDLRKRQLNIFISVKFRDVNLVMLSPTNHSAPKLYFKKKTGQLFKIFKFLVSSCLVNVTKFSDTIRGQ